MAAFNIPIYSTLFSLLCVVHTQELHVTQKPVYITRSVGKTAKFVCKVDGLSVISKGLHWYHQDHDKNIKWLLFFKPTQKQIPEEYQDRISLDTETDSLCTMSITNIKAMDDGTYFCAAWHTNDAGVKVFGTGTKLTVITSQSVAKPEAIILSSSKEAVKNTGQLIHMCLLKNFFPDVITVTWKKSDEVIESEQGEMRLNDATKKYSVASWITVRKSDIGKIFTCNYKHEGVETNSQWESIATKSQQNTVVIEDTKDENVNDEQTQNFDNHSSLENVHFNPTTYKAASLIYTLLLLKSALYCPILIITYKATV